jgi:hypothetical protein
VDVTTNSRCYKTDGEFISGIQWTTGAIVLLNGFDRNIDTSEQLMIYLKGYDSLLALRNIFSMLHALKEMQRLQ